VAVTPDALGPHWDGRKLHGAVEVYLNGREFGRADAGVDMTFDFGELIAHAAKTRSLCAGTVIGSGTISNRGPDGGPGAAIANGGVGYSCLTELRTVETLASGEPSTPFLTSGDVVRIEMRDSRHHTIFGAIEQTIAGE
jgi:fumarylacetoacetate (FAA) hydrolase